MSNEPQRLEQGFYLVKREIKTVNDLLKCLAFVSLTDGLVARFYDQTALRIVQGNIQDRGAEINKRSLGKKLNCQEVSALIGGYGRAINFISAHSDELEKEARLPIQEMQEYAREGLLGKEINNSKLAEINGLVYIGRINKVLCRLNKSDDNHHTNEKALALYKKTTIDGEFFGESSPSNFGKKSWKVLHDYLQSMDLIE